LLKHRKEEGGDFEQPLRLNKKENTDKHIEGALAENGCEFGNAGGKRIDRGPRFVDGLFKLYGRNDEGKN